MDQSKVLDYKKFKARVEACRACPLKHQRCYLATGPITATLMIVGQAPSPNRCTPIHFSGRSRIVFAKFLEALGVHYNDVWITNAVKCIGLYRQFGKPDRCQHFIRKEIQIVKPKEIFVFGTIANVAIFDSQIAYSSFKWPGDGIVYHILPHPMSVLYNPKAGKKTFELAVQKMLDYRKKHHLDSRGDSQ